MPESRSHKATNPGQPGIVAGRAIQAVLRYSRRRVEAFDLLSLQNDFPMPSATTDTEAAVARSRNPWDLLARGKFGEAEAIFRGMLATDERNIPARIGLARIALAEQQPDMALEWLDEATRLAPPKPTWLLLKGRALYDLNHRDEAERAFRDCIAARPDEAEAHFRLAGLLRRAGRQMEALQALAAPALQGEPLARAAVLDCLIETWQMPRAIALFDGWLADTSPRNLAALFPVAARLFGKGPVYESKIRRIRDALDAPGLAAGDGLLRCRVHYALGETSDLRSEIERLGSTPVSRPIAAALAGVLGKAPPRRKVFGIGLSRTGTKSLTLALQMLGLRAQHWINALTSHMLDGTDAASLDAIIDGWPSDNFERLAEDYPDALFVVTERERGSWSRSFHEHWRRVHSVASLDELRSRLDDPATLCPHGEQWREVEGRLYASHLSAEDAYEAHCQRVSAFFASKPNRLLRLPLEHPEPWALLCPFLGLPVPNAPYPHLS